MELSTDNTTSRSRYARHDTNVLPSPESDNSHESTSNDSHVIGGAAERQDRNVSYPARHYPVPFAPMISNATWDHDLVPRISEPGTSLSASEAVTGFNTSITDRERELHVECAERHPAIASDTILDTSQTRLGPPIEDLASKNLPRKRGRSTVEERQGTNFKVLRSSGRTNPEPRLKRKGSLSGQSCLFSRPLSSDGNRGDIQEALANQNDRLNVSTSGHVLNHETDGGFHEVPMSPNDFVDYNRIHDFHPNPNNAMIAEDNEGYNGVRNDEVDSVQGSSEDGQDEGPPPQETVGPQGSSLVVKLKLSHAAGKLKLDRKRLSLKFPKALNLSWEQPQLLKETLTLISRLKTANKRRLEQCSGTSNNITYQQILDHWLDFVQIFLDFQQTAVFDGDREKWNAHLQALTPAARFTASECHIAASISLDEWRLNKARANISIDTFSSEVTPVIVAMAEWLRPFQASDIEELKDRMVRLNQSIFDFFQ